VLHKPDKLISYRHGVAAVLMAWDFLIKLRPLYLLLAE
jgi:hypothetical protein